MKETTLCYIEKDGAYLMMHRIKKQADINHDKWIGVGGKIEKSETPTEAILREIKEETGVSPLKLIYRGVVYFISDEFGSECMHLFTSDGYIGKINYVCDEGELKWIKKDKVFSLPIWEGDKIFFKLLDSEKNFFYLTLNYQGEKLTSYDVHYEK